MKNLLRFSLCFALCLILCISGALAEFCRYGSNDSQCDIIWWVDTEAKLHCRACRNHVTDKEDPYSHVPVTEWEACTPDEGGECTGCGWDYIRDNTGGSSGNDDWGGVDEEALWEQLREILMYVIETGASPFDVSIADETMSVALSEAVFTTCDDFGMPVSESMAVPTEYSFAFEGDTKVYPYTGKAITPATLESSEYGPGRFFTEYGFMEIGDVEYENNVNPGTATASAEFVFIGMDADFRTLAADFTITGEGIGGGDSKPTHCKYGSDDTCELGWTIDRNNQTHTRICTTHVENKEDMYSYVVVYGPEDCTIGEDEKCTVCHQDYKKDDGTIKPEHYDAYMMEYYYAMGYPIRMWVEDETLFMALSAEYFAALEKQGLVIPDSMKLPTAYSFTFEGDTKTYPYTGSAITPATLGKNENGPADFLLRVGLLTVGDPVYTDNVNPGEATVSVTFTAKKNITETLTVPFTITGGGIGGGEDEDETEYCEYGSKDSPCHIEWRTDVDDRYHYSLCTSHVTDKEDPFSHVVVTEWEPCTLDASDKCTKCGHDYSQSSSGGENDDILEELEPYLLEGMMVTIEMGYNPFDVSIVDKTMYVGFSEDALDTFDALGFPVHESILVPTEYSFEFEGGVTTFAYTGKAITPAALTQSEYGPGNFFAKHGFMYIDDLSYQNNVNPGTASVSADFTFIGFDTETYTLSDTFTITGEGGIPGIGGGEDEPGFTWPLPEDTMLILPKSTTKVKAQAFRGISAESIRIPEGCVAIEPYAFADCQALTSVVILGNDTGIAALAFDGCDDLTIIAPEGSKAQTFANEKGYTFRVLPE